MEVLASKVEDDAELSGNNLLFPKSVEIIYHQSKPFQKKAWLRHDPDHNFC